jgi:transcriptional regulator with XRE-family HTH domain
MTSAATLAFTAPAPTPAGTSSFTGKRELSLAQRLALGSRLTELREAAGFSQLEVARQALGFTVSHAAVSRLERGVFGVVENAQLDKLATFYGSSVDALLAEMEGRQADDEPDDFRSTDSLEVQPGIGRRLFHLRQAARFTKLQMVTALGYAPSSVKVLTDWEREVATPRPDTLLDIAIALRVSASWLITGRRAKPAQPTLSMRLRAMQKMYDLSNREVALMAGIDLEHGPQTVARISRGRKNVSDTTLAAVAQALDVPMDWISPPAEGFAPVAAPAQAVTLDGTSPKAALFLSELADLFSSAVLQDHDIGKLRQRFLHELMTAQKPARAGRNGGQMRTA